ncbi:MAG: UDP-2,3-diacylglucosamine diphosphatase [Bacteroidetes bacterium]|nr:UDP-2,3-diacylglucosamine diphosphatase [Bacteroidota bacterium]
MTENRKIYFASDFHLGVPTIKASRQREASIIRWLDFVKQDAKELYLVGDLFDFWFEHKYTVPKGHVRFLGKLAEIVDSGIPIHVFTGNHDMWMFDYLKEEIGVYIHRTNVERVWDDKKFLIGHGDGLGPGDHGYKFLKRLFANKFCQWLFARLHPNFSFGLAHLSSKKSRLHTASEDEKYLGDDQEWLAIYSKEILEKEHFDYFIFGHRHLPIDLQLNDKSRYLNLGEWINYRSYAVFDNGELSLKYWEKD